MVYMVTFAINIPQMLAYVPYMDPMGIISEDIQYTTTYIHERARAPTGQSLARTLT